MARLNFKPLVCAGCGRKDVSDKATGYVGTSTEMRCPDCGGPSTEKHPHALLCRGCCPTGHGTLIKVNV